jgi:hypothetical protein
MAQVDADYKLQDMKKAYKELELKGNGFRKKLDDLKNALIKHMEQYVFFMNYSLDLRCLNDFEACLTLYTGRRIQKDSVDPEKLQVNLTDGALN